MIRWWPWLLFMLLCLVLSACTPVTPSGPPQARPEPVRAPLPVGAERLSGPPEQVRFPATSLYPPGAALPSAGGLGRLEDLATWLQGDRQGRWQVVVSGEPGGSDESALAAKRLALLRRFFARQGLAVSTWEWQVAAGGSVDLQLIRLSGGP